LTNSRTLIKNGLKKSSRQKNYVRESKWTQSIIVGSKTFVDNIKEKLGIWVKGKKVGELGGLYYLRESQAAYNSNFTPKNSDPRAKNTYNWSYNP
jgi:putative transposase